ncbi:diguanylate cyclase [Methylotenera sp.]|uniref:sensor domain-containing diguanylate cyclase n=1 Tax=Methylotenera sp. TaxID=2051956 RepID=UPI002ED9B68F
MNFEEMHTRLPLPYRYLIAIALFLIALFLCFIIAPAQENLAYITFYLPTLISFYLLGTGPGILVAILSAIAGEYYFVKPFGILLSAQKSYLPLIFFALTSCLIGLIITRLSHYSDELKHAEVREKFRSHVLELITKGAPLANILRAIILWVEQENPAIRGSIMLLDSEGKRLLATAAPNLPRFYVVAINNLSIGEGVGSCGTAAFTGKRVIVEDIQNHPYWHYFKELAGQARLGACWSEPIRSTQGKILGTVAIYHQNTYQPTEANIMLIEQAAYLASIAIEKNHSELALKKNEERWRFALEGAGDGVWEYDFQTGKTEASPRLMEILGLDANLPEDIERFHHWAAHTHPDSITNTMMAIEAMKDNKTDRYQLEQQKLCGDGSYKWLLNRGMVISRSSDGKPLRMIGTSTDITERKQLEDEFKRQARIDFLTGVSNRRYFMEQAEQEIQRTSRYDTPLSFFMLDIDLFKQVNDTYGHKSGDIVLKRMAAVCRETLREIDIIGRVGGEEFAILLPETDKAQAAEVAERLRAVLANEKVPLEAGVPIQFTVSIGVASRVSKQDNIDMLLNLADEALYQAKKYGRNRVYIAMQ